MARCIVIPVEGAPFEADLDLSTYTGFRSIIDGWVENVWVNAEASFVLGYDRLSLIVDEEGLVKDLPLNRTATPLYVGNPTYGVIAGPAVLVHNTMDDEGSTDWAALPKDITPEMVVAASGYAMQQAGVAWAE